MISVTYRLLQSRYCFINNRLSFYSPNCCRTSGLSFPVEKLVKSIIIKKIKQIDFRLILYSPLLLCYIDDKSELKGATSKLLTTGFLPNAMTGLSTCNFHPSFRIKPINFCPQTKFVFSSFLRLWATRPLLCVIVVFLQHHSEGD